MRPLATLTLVLGAISTAGAQAPDDRTAAADGLAARIAAAAGLPALADEIRAAGVPQQDLAAVLTLLGEKRVPATDAHQILDEEWRAAREHGPVPGLGRFVRGRLDEGLRGQALAEAIRQEHARRGTGGDQAGKPSPRKDGSGAAPPTRKRGGGRDDRPGSGEPR